MQLRGNHVIRGRTISFVVFNGSDSLQFHIRVHFPVKSCWRDGKEAAEWNLDRVTIWADMVISLSSAPDRLFGPFEFTDMYYPVSGAFVVGHPKLGVHWNTLFLPLIDK